MMETVAEDRIIKGINVRILKEQCERLAEPIRASTRSFQFASALDNCVEVINALEASNAELEAAKWQVRHVDTANDLASMGMARDAAEARAEAAESQMSEIAGHLDSECDSDSILHVIREAEADRDIYKERAEAAEALLKEAKTALEPFAKVVEHDISTGEDDRDVFRPMPGQYARAERITVGHLRAARAISERIGVKDE